MDYVIYGLKETRITLYEDDGSTPRYRVTLEKEAKEGLNLVFKQEGVVHPLGSGADWARTVIHRGFRVSLDIKWGHGEESLVETWNGSEWADAAKIPTAQALSVIQTWAYHNPCLVSPHQDLNFAFLAQPDPGKAFDLSDIKGRFHRDLELHLIATKLIKDIPDWSNLNDYFSDFYTEGIYGTFTP